MLNTGATKKQNKTKKTLENLLNLKKHRFGTFNRLTGNW